jgi:hypothetical protein
LLPLLANWSITVTGEHPGEPLSYQFLIGKGIADFDKGNGPAITISRHRLNLNGLGPVRLVASFHHPALQDQAQESEGSKTR